MLQKVLPSDKIREMVDKVNSAMDSVEGLENSLENTIEETRESIEIIAKDSKTYADVSEDNAKAYTDQQIQFVTETGIPKLASYSYLLTATTENQVAFTIPLETFDHSTDTILVVQNRSILTATDYTVSGKILTLAEGVSVGTDVAILVLKNVPVGPEGSINGAVIGVGTLPADRIIGGISSSADKIATSDAGNYFASTDVEGSLQEIGYALNGARGNLVDSINGVLNS